ncbi:MAG: hypothetical protein COV34_01140 [Candidatus Zambryskibacteria bacterium CG10_big_fil_rev_8_21_14_0_10_42_12]|uniref:Protease PrsW n=1 Tax=Candidatus Zambryskibacteria bacterium CG10_big_fil_rev_8_21_14_0_10_42_12 TaxID=1975115 RepID=A0A2H0QX65_9BACT|nr:MAG: hypothetical protein COV34_01140 [Candidatus Zambryskibacteria bacterium CG10_big_fil_rev_8_21_14_0_10_42_12]
MNAQPDTLLWALTLGTIPAAIWLLFWLREDKKHPEPLRVIISCFLLGGVAVFFSVVAERFALPYLKNNLFLIILVWSVIEEVFKYWGALLGGFMKSSYNEPIDAIIYMLTTALGFAAFENTLYILNSLNGSSLLESIVVSNFRFVGASMLHFLSSVVLGSFIAFGFYKTPKVRKLYAFCGLLTAIALHAVFNLLIIEGALRHTTIAFISVWIFIVAFIAIIERIKKLSPLSEEIKL